MEPTLCVRSVKYPFGITRNGKGYGFLSIKSFYSLLNFKTLFASLILVGKVLKDLKARDINITAEAMSI